MVEWVGELLGGEGLAGNRVNTDAPACQTRVKRVQVGCCALGYLLSQSLQFYSFRKRVGQMKTAG